MKTNLNTIYFLCSDHHTKLSSLSEPPAVNNTHHDRNQLIYKSTADDIFWVLHTSKSKGTMQIERLR